MIMHFCLFGGLVKVGKDVQLKKKHAKLGMFEKGLISTSGQQTSLEKSLQ